MNEVANILNNATKDSLIVLDEIGRGTSTYDGLSIAWAVTEYISSKAKVGAKTLFATHYHELTELENKLDGVKNYKVAVKENDSGSITFLRTIVRGEADRSYGIEVAKLAGVRREVIDRACEILEDLEENDINKKREVKDIQIETKVKKVEVEVVAHDQSKAQLDQTQTKEVEKTPLEILAFERNSEEYKDNNKYDHVIDEIKSLDMINTTPLDSMNILYKLWSEVQRLNKE